MIEIAPDIWVNLIHVVKVRMDGIRVAVFMTDKSVIFLSGMTIKQVIDKLKGF